MLSSLPLQAQEQGQQTTQNKPLTDEEWKAMPLYQGTMLGIDVAGLAGKALGNDVTSSEVIVTANLKNRFFPVAEIGYGTIDTTDEAASDRLLKASAWMEMEPERMPAKNLIPKSTKLTKTPTTPLTNPHLPRAAGDFRSSCLPAKILRMIPFIQTPEKRRIEQKKRYDP